MLFWVLAALAVVGALAIVWGLYLFVSPLALAASGEGDVPLVTTPARKWRSDGRIEQTLLDGDAAPTDLRPSPANHTIPQKVTYVSICYKGPEPLRAPAR